MLVVVMVSVLKGVRLGQEEWKYEVACLDPCLGTSDIEKMTGEMSSIK